MAGFNISSSDFKKILKQNNYEHVRSNGDHAIFKHRGSGAVISVPQHLNPLIARRLVRENNLVIKK